MHLHRDELDTEGCVEVITTVEHLGRYQQKLREKRRATQKSLSVKLRLSQDARLTDCGSPKIKNVKRDKSSNANCACIWLALVRTPSYRPNGEVS